MSAGTLAVMAIWLGGVAAVCRADPLGPPVLGAAIALAGAALLATLG